MQRIRFPRRPGHAPAPAVAPWRVVVAAFAFVLWFVAPVLAQAPAPPSVQGAAGGAAPGLAVPTAASATCPDFAPVARTLQMAADEAILRSAASFPTLRSADSFIVPDRGRVRFELGRAIDATAAPRLVALWRPVDAGAQAACLLPIREVERQAEKTLLRIELPSVGFGYFPMAAITVLGLDGGAAPSVQFAASVEVRVAGRNLAAAVAVLVPLALWVGAAWLCCRGRFRSRGWRAFDPVVMAQDPLGRASLARLQMLFFTAVTICLLCYISMRTGLPGDVSTDLMVLLGITGGGSLASAAVGSRGGGLGLGLSEEAVGFARARGWLRRTRLPSWSELVMHRGALDIYRLQSLVFSVVVTYALFDTGFLLLAFYDVPDGMMTLLGISQGTYVASKAIEQQSDTSSLQQGIDQLIAQEANGAMADPSLEESVRRRFMASLGFDDPADETVRRTRARPPGGSGGGTPADAAAVPAKVEPA